MQKHRHDYHEGNGRIFSHKSLEVMACHLGLHRKLPGKVESMGKKKIFVVGSIGKMDGAGQFRTSWLESSLQALEHRGYT